MLQVLHPKGNNKYMKLILKYLKPHINIIAVCLLLLFGQAVSELYLPNLMSDIVDTGIQLGGVKEGAPEVISRDGMELLEFFMAEGKKQDIIDIYILADVGSIKSKEITEKFPEAKSKDVFILKQDIDKEAKEKADTAYSNSTYAYMLFMQDYLKELGVDISENREAGFADFEASDLYEIKPMLVLMPESSFDEYIKIAEADTLLSSKVGTTFTRLFYKELGADMEAVQKDYIIKIGLFMLGVALIGVFAAIAVGYFAAKISSVVAKNIRHDIFERVNSFANTELDRFSTASLITRTTNDTQQVQMLIVMGIRIMCFAPIMGLGGVFMAIQKSVSLSRIIAVAVMFLLGLVLVLLAIVMPKFKALQKLIDKLNLVSRENLSGLMVIRAFGNEEHEEKRFDGANEDLKNTTRFVNRSMALIMPLMMFIMNAVSLTIIWIGAKEIADSTLQIGDMLAFIQYSMHIIISFIMISMMFVFVPRALVSANRIKEVMDCEISITDKPDTKELSSVKGVVEYKNVSFRYNDAESNVLEEISFTAMPGQTTAIIGSTGSGKTTLINLLPRFYDVSSGAVLIDGVDIRQLAQKELRDKIGYVPQKGVLFSGTIDSNIRYGNEEADENDVLTAIETAQATEFVKQKEDGVNSAISQMGMNVSGGQKQRLSIARALVKKPPIYVFDDSFSALDFKTDAKLRKALKNNTSDSTVIIVAQRVSTIMNAEQIMVLDNGRIVGKGTHRELLASCPEYREIAESQLSEEELKS